MQVYCHINQPLGLLLGTTGKPWINMDKERKVKYNMDTVKM